MGVIFLGQDSEIIEEIANYIYYASYITVCITNEVLSMVEIGRAISDVTHGFERKIKHGPPEAPDIVNKALSIPADVEHDSPLPPLVERVHRDITQPVLYRMPRILSSGPGMFDRLRF
jgi:hypothetical protein